MCKENCCAKTPNMLAVVKHALQNRFRDSELKCEPIVLSSVSQMPVDLFIGEVRASFYFGNFSFDLPQGERFHLEYNGSPFDIENERALIPDLLVDSIYSYKDDSFDNTLSFVFYGWRIWAAEARPYSLPQSELTPFNVSSVVGDACTMFAAPSYDVVMWHDGENDYPIVGDTVYKDYLGTEFLVTAVDEDVKIDNGDYLRTDAGGQMVEILCK